MLKMFDNFADPNCSAVTSKTLILNFNFLHQMTFKSYLVLVCGQVRR